MFSIIVRHLHTISRSRSVCNTSVTRHCSTIELRWTHVWIKSDLSKTEVSLKARREFLNIFSSLLGTRVTVVQSKYRHKFGRYAQIFYTQTIHCFHRKASQAILMTNHQDTDDHLRLAESNRWFGNRIRLCFERRTGFV